jgi:hypothetical protein
MEPTPEVVGPTPEVVVGSIICYKGLTEPEGWIFCDGIPRENIDGKYDELVNIEIGTIEETMYIPPNYDNFMITQLGDSYEKVLEFLLDDVKAKKVNERCHTYLKRGTFSREYNNDFIGIETDYENITTKPELQHHQVRWILKT